MILPYSKHSMKDTKPHVSNCLNLCPLDCSQPLYLRTSYVKEKASEASAKHVGVGGWGLPIQSSLPFCARVQLSRDSIHAFNDRTKIRENRELWTVCVDAFSFTCTSKMYGFLHQLTLASHSLVKYWFAKRCDLCVSRDIDEFQLNLARAWSSWELLIQLSRNSQTVTIKGTEQ